MRNTKFFTPLRLLILVLLLVSLLTSFAVGKYFKQMSHTGSVTFSANLAENMYLRESVVKQNSDGTYETTADYIDSTDTTNSQEYILIPGVDIPKDPYILIENKSDIKAKLYVEIVVTTPDAVRFSVTDDWKEVPDKTGDHGGTLYEYKVVLDDKNCPENEISILKDNKVYIDHGLLNNSFSEGSITFHAYLEEVQTGT